MALPNDILLANSEADGVLGEAVCVALFKLADQQAEDPAGFHLLFWLDGASKG